VRKKLKEIADIQVGYQFREKLDLTSKGNYQVIQAKDIDRSTSHRLDPSNLYIVTPKRPAKKYTVRNGDVIFLSKGRRNYATFIEDLPSDSQTIVAGYFFIIRLKTKVILSEYLAWSINQPPSQSYLQRAARGSGMPFIPKDALSNLEIDVPSVKIQKLIIKLYELSLKEAQLLNLVKYKRNEFLQGVCLGAARSKHRS